MIQPQERTQHYDPDLPTNIFMKCYKSFWGEIQIQIFIFGKEIFRDSNKNLILTVIQPQECSQPYDPDLPTTIFLKFLGVGGNIYNPSDFGRDIFHDSGII